MSAWTDAVAAAPAPYLWWKLDETSGTTAADATGNGRSGTYSSPTLNQATIVPGDAGGKSVTLATTAANIARSSGLSFSNVGVTYAQTFKTSTDFSSGRLFLANIFSTFLGFNATNMTASIATGQTPTLEYDPSNLCDGNAHFIVYVVRVSTVELWVDGVMVASASHSATATTMSAFQVKQGSSNPTGSFDEVLIWSSALSAGEIGALQAGWSGSSPSYAAATTLSVSGAATAAPVAAAATVLAVAAGAAAAAAAPAATVLAVDSSVSAYAVGEAIPTNADTTLGVAGSVGVVPVATTGADTGLSVAAAATATALYAVDVVTELAVQTSAASVVGEAAVVSGTATDRREGGRSREGLAVATWSPPFAVPSAAEPMTERHVGSQAFSVVTMDGAQPRYAVSAATKKKLRHRILVGGRDVSFYRDVATPEPGYQLAEPLLWGPCTIEFPQIAAAFEQPGIGALRWSRKGAPVELQRVTAAGEIVSVDYRGIVVGWDVTGPSLRLECGGHATGRAALRHKPLPIFRDTLDLGRLAWAAIRDLGLRFEPRLGPTTGIKQALWGGMDHLTYITELCAKAWERDGTQWTVMPSDAGVYRMKRKDRETIDFTVFTDDKRAVPQLRSDAAEEPNRIFAAGVTPKGQRVRFGVYPGLKPTPAAPYPFADNRVFGVGTADEDTDTGDGVFVMVRRLWTAGYLSLEDASGEYDADVAKAVSALAEDARIPADFGMSPSIWAALFDLDTTGYSLRGSRIEPAAQASWTQRYRRSASGAVLGKNPDFRNRGLIVDRHIEFGAGFTRHQMREWARAEVARGEDNWVGTLKINTGGVLHGQVEPGTTIGGDDVMEVRAIKPGMNAYLPMFGGGIVVHVAGVEISYSDGVPNATLYVDTQARDAMTVWEIIRRNRESRRDPARRWKGPRASSEVKDSITEWDEVGGVLYDDVDLQRGWNVIPVVAGQEGTVSRIRLIVQDLETSGGDIAIQGREFACAVFGKKVTPKRLRALIGNPLAASPDSTAEPLPDDVDPPETDPETDGGDPGNSTSPNRPWWEKKANVDALRDLDLLYSVGTHEEPCGYSPGKKSNGGTKTGMHRDDAGFSYRTRAEPVLYLAVWVWGERTLTGGRVMWPQLEAGA